MEHVKVRGRSEFQRLGGHDSHTAVRLQGKAGHAGGRPRLTWRYWKQFSWAANIPARRSAKDRILELRSWGFSTWNSSSTRQG